MATPDAGLELQPQTTALLVVDMTNEFAAEGSRLEGPARARSMARARSILPRLCELADACRSAGALVAFTTQVHRANGHDLPVTGGGLADRVTDAAGRPRVCVEGSPGVRIVDELAPQPQDVVIEKHRSSAFAGTDLDLILRRNRIDTVLISGTATQGCCWAAAIDAAGLDYRVVFVSDCTAAGELPDRHGGVVTAEEAQRCVESTISFSVGRVASAATVIDALRAPSRGSASAERTDAAAGASA